MKKLLFLLLLVMAVPVTMMAEEVTIDGIKYDLVTKAKVATVIKGGNYTGDIVIPSTVTYNNVVYNVKEIGASAFSGCSGLTSVTIPSSVTSIEQSAFIRCTGLTSVTIHDGVTSIGESAFQQCSGLTSITIPNSVTSIGSSAFWDCSGLTSVAIPDGVTSIGSNAFCNCSGLTSVAIPDGVTSIGQSAFSGCSGLTSITVDPGNTVYDSRNNCNAIIETSTNQLITGCKNTIIPSNVTSIGGLAFDGCTGLTSIDIPDGVTSIGQGAFRGCSGLTSIEIPNSVTSIGWFAFLKCTGLISINIPNSVTSIEEQTFYNCSGLTSIEIPNSVTSIGRFAFRGCSGLTSVAIPDGVTSIEKETFYNCSSLTSVDIGSGVTSIGSSAFQNCENLIAVTCRATSVPSTNTNAFDGSYVEYITLIVPDESVDAYSTTAPWSSFNPILPLSSATVVTANSYTREYGDANPTFEYTSGVTLNGELDITCAADENSAPGIYPITISQGTVTNTGLVLVDGTLTVTKAPLTITANNYTIKEGDALPAFDAVFTGLKNGEPESVVNPAITCTATDSNTPGTYDINVTASSDNYVITIVKGTLTIQPTDVTITITSAGMATYCSPYDLDFSNVTGLKAYTINGYDRASQKVYAMRVYDVPAGTGLYLVGNQGDYTVNVGNSSSYYINMLVGTLAETWIEPTDGEYTNFRLTGTSPTNASFKALTQGRNFSANRAYLQIPTSVYNGTANAVGIIFDDEADGIENISMEDAGTDWFTLDGRKLNGKPTTKGIYVVNGRKVVIK